MSNVLSMYNSKYTHLRTNAVNERMKWRKELRNSLALDRDWETGYSIL